MNARGQLALELVVGSLALGVLGDALLRAGPWGLNVLVWTALLLAAALILVMRHKLALDARAAWLGGGALVVAGGFAWRDAPALKLLDFASLCGLLALALWRARGVRLGVGGVVENCGRFAFAGVQAVIGCVPLFTGPPLWTTATPAGWRGRARTAAVGGLLALPVLLVFGALFMSADAVFNNLVVRLVRFNLGEAASHFVPVAVCSWITAGWLLGLLLPERLPVPRLTPPQFLKFRPAEIGLALGLVNVLFLAFILVQLRYLFGGAGVVRITPDLTYAEYARRGFFELVAVVALALPVLLAADWLLGAASRRAFRVQAALLILMLGVVLGSAFVRMRLYQAEYGWTELRFYVTAFMGCLLVVLLWFAATVLSGRRERFVSGALLAGLGAVGLLHAWNPDAWIARQNLAHARAGHEFDAAYALRLSADAFPPLLAAWPELDSPTRDRLTTRLTKWRANTPPDWRSWSWSIARAREAIRQRESELREHQPDFRLSVPGGSD